MSPTTQASSIRPPGEAEEGGPRVLDASASRLDAPKGAAMGAAPGHSGDDPIFDREDLVDAIVPVRKSGPNDLDVALEILPPLANVAQRPAKTERVGHELIGERELPAIPQLVIEAPDHGLVVCHLERNIGAPGFEPGTSATQRRRATRLRHAPMRSV